MTARNVQVMPRRFDTTWLNVGAASALRTPMQDQPISTPIKDRSGNGNDGTITGAVWTKLPSGLWVLSFDGTDDLVNCGGSATLKFTIAGSFTVAAWINSALDSADRSIAANFPSTAVSPGYQLRVSAANKVRFVLATDGTNYKYSDTGVLSPGWHLVGGISTAGTLTTYVDGVLNSTTGGSGIVTSITSTTDFIIGATSNGAQYFKGYMGGVRVFPTARSANEIMARYQQERHLYGV